MKILKDFRDREIRLTRERLEHIHRREEMETQINKIQETLRHPEEIRKSKKDATVHLYYKKYDRTPVTEKYLLVVVKILAESPFIITAFFTDQIKSGTLVEK